MPRCGVVPADKKCIFSISQPCKMARAMGHGRACLVPLVPAADGQGAERVLRILGTDRRSASMRMHALAH